MKKYISCMAALLLAYCHPLPAAPNVKTYIPVNATKYLPLVKTTVVQYWPNPLGEYFPALIEHESCISLTHKRCFDPTSRLKTDREEGGGLAQLTRAYRKDGSIRFDALAEQVKLDKSLKELTWDNLYSRPDLQIRVAINMTRANYNRVTALNFINKMHMADAAYNAGYGRILTSRRLCAQRPDCNPLVWFDNLEKYCLNNKPIYGNRSACDINNHHVRDVFENRLPKYSKIWPTI